MDLEDLDAWWLVDGSLASATVHESRVILDRMMREGLDLARFASSPDAARLEVRAYMAARRREGTSAFTLRQMGKVFNRVAAYLADQDRAWRDVKWRLVPEPRVEGKLLSAAQMKALLEFKPRRQKRNLIEDKRRRALVYVTVHLGIRRGEIAKIRVSDLDPERSGVWVSHPTKKGPRRLLWLPQDAFSPKRPLAAWLAVRPVDPEAPDALWTRRDLKNGGWRAFTEDDVSSEWTKMGKLLGFNVCPTMLRRNDTQYLDEKGVHPRVIQRRRGHASIGTTMRYLGAVSAERELKELRRARVPGDRRTRE